MTLRRLRYIYKELRKDESKSVHRLLKRYKLIAKVRSMIWRIESALYFQKQNIGKYQ